jgi:hypothetical protein
MIIDTLNAMHSYLIVAVDNLTASNCTVEDASVFNNILELDPPVEHCVIIGFSGADESRQKPEFGSYIMDWRILVNVFHLLDGDEVRRHEQTIEHYENVDKIMIAVKEDFTLNSLVMDSKLVDVTPTFAYSRSDINNYVMSGITFLIKENM